MKISLVDLSRRCWRSAKVSLAGSGHAAASDWRINILSLQLLIWVSIMEHASVRLHGVTVSRPLPFGFKCSSASQLWPPWSPAAPRQATSCGPRCERIRWIGFWRCMPNTPTTFLISGGCVAASRWWDSFSAPVRAPWSPDVTTPAPGSEFACACNCPAPQAVDCTGRDRVVTYCPLSEKVSWFCAGLGLFRLISWLKWAGWSVLRAYARASSGDESGFAPVTRPFGPRLALQGGPVTPSELKRRRDG